MSFAQDNNKIYRATTMPPLRPLNIPRLQIPMNRVQSLNITQPPTAGQSTHGEEAALTLRASKTYHNGPQQIMPYLYLGNQQNAQSPQQLHRLGIQHIVTVAREIHIEKQHHCIQYSNVGWDHDESDIERHFNEWFGKIDCWRQSGEAVLVHCQLGVSRSASLVIAYVMRTMGWEFRRGYEYVRVRAACVSPNLSLIAQLAEYGKTLAEVPELSVSSSSSSSENSSPTDVPQVATKGFYIYE